MSNSDQTLRAALVMARAKLQGGEDSEQIESHLVDYLIMQGWSVYNASRYAADIVRDVVAERDGFAGGGVEP